MEHITTIEQLYNNLSGEDQVILKRLVFKAEKEKKRRIIEEEIAKLQGSLVKLEADEFLEEENNIFTTQSLLNDKSSYYGEVKIGEFVKTEVRNIFENNQVTASEIELLQQKAYCKQIFDLNFPLLSKEMYDENGYARYYKAPVYINGERFYLCSQWYKWQLEKLQNWVEKH